jgi:hypothetical protein
MSFMPIENNRLKDLTNPGGNIFNPSPSRLNTLEQLATMFLASNQPQEEKSPFIQGPKGPILDARKKGFMDYMMPSLRSLATNFLIAQKYKQKQEFLKSVNTVMGSNATTDDKVEALIRLKAQYGDDFGLGIDDIVAQYSKMHREWKPKTMREAVEFERAKAGIKEQTDKAKLQREKTKFDLISKRGGSFTSDELEGQNLLEYAEGYGLPKVRD